MSSRYNLKTNSSGYSDPTAFHAIAKTELEEKRFHKLLGTIFNLCDLSGFHVEGRIILRDKRTGRIWE